MAAGSGQFVFARRAAAVFAGVSVVVAVVVIAASAPVRRIAGRAWSILVMWIALAHVLSL